MNTLFLATLALAMIVVAKGEMPPQILEHQKACSGQFNVSEKEINEIRFGTNEPNISDNIKCFTKCFFERIGAVLANGDIIESNTLELFSPGNPEKEQIIKDTLKKCGEMNQPKGSCDGIFKVYNCLTQDLVKQRFYQ